MKNKILSIVITSLLFLTAFSSFAFADCNHTITVTNGTPYTFGVNDTCLSGGGWSFYSFTQNPSATCGSVSNVGNNITYTATGNCCGTGVDTFKFEARKGGGNNPQIEIVTVTVNINCGTPGADCTHSFSVNCDSYENIDFDLISCISANSNHYQSHTNPSHGSVSVISNRMIRYTPVSGYSGPDSFTFTAGGKTVQVNVTVTCNSPPIPDCTYYVDYNCATGDIIVGGTTYNYINVNDAAKTCYPTANYKGSVFLVNPNPGTAVFAGQGNQIDYSLSDCSGYCGQTDTLTFLADKFGAGGDIPDPITIKVVIGIICSKPITNPDTASVCNNACVNVSVLNNDSNYGTSPVLTVIEGPTAGTAIQSGNRINYCAPTTPGTYDFNYTITNGQSTSNKAKVTITVNNCGQTNNPPVAVNDNYEICMNEELTVLAGLGVLANDTDPEGDPLEVYEHQTDIIGPANGTLIINGDGSFTYTPNEGFHGIDTFTYRASDFDAVSERATVTITVLECLSEKKLLPSSILYPGIDIVQLTVPSSGANVILGGKVVSPLEIVPGTQSLSVQVKNKGFLTQIDAGVRLEGLPQGVAFTLEPSTQKIKGHNTGTYTMTLTVPPTTPQGTYPIKAVSYSRRGITDRVEFNLIVD